MAPFKPESGTFFVPIFPLQVVVFPGELFNLHIFEPRYKSMVKDVEQTNGLFAVLPVLQKQPAEFATVVKLESIYRTYPDGAMDIRTSGLQVVRILHWDIKTNKHPYPTGIVSSNHNLQEKLMEGTARPDVWHRFREALQELGKHLGVTRNFIPSNNHFAVFRVIHYLGLKTEQEYEMLFCKNETERMLLTIDLLQQVIPDVKRKEEVRQRISLNGHFKNLKSPEF